MELKLRASYILLAVSVVILAIGIILTVNYFTHDRPPVITVLVDRTVVVPTGENQRFDFDIPRTGVLKVTVEVESGGIIYFHLFKGSSLWWTGEEGNAVIRSSFEVPIDTGSYYLNLRVPEYSWWSQQWSPEARTVHIYLAFEG